MEIKDKIKQRRLELRLTLEEVATAVGVAKSTVKKWESGQIASMRQSKIVALARILQVDPTYLIIEDTQPNMNLGINHGIIGNQNSNNTIIVEGKDEAEPYGEIENEILSLCKKMNMQQKAKLLTYAYELLGE